MMKTHAQVTVLRKGSLEVPEGALHPAVATSDPVEASGAHNGVALITEQQELQQCEEQDTNFIGQIHLQLMLASITDEHQCRTI